MEGLPIDDDLPELIDALKRARQAVLQAPPGAGKTTRVPLAILDAGFCPGRIVMLEPRRLAARAAAGVLEPKRIIVVLQPAVCRQRVSE